MEEQEVIDSFILGNEVLSILNKLKTPPNAPARLVLITKNFDKDFTFLWENIRQESFDLTKVTENDNHILWSIEPNRLLEDEELIECPHCKKNFKINPEEKFKIKNYLVEFKKSNLMIFISNSKNSFHELKSFFNGLYPLISRVFYRASDLRLLLEKIRNLPSVEVIGRKCVVKRLYDDKKTIVTYKEDTVEGFYDRAKRENGWIDSLEVNITPLGVVSFHRKGFILISKPFNFSGFFEIVVNTIIKGLLFERRESLKDKYRNLDKPQEIKPITIKFDTDYFSDKENINKLIKRLNEAEKYEISVLYLSEGLTHIEVYDYANGGGFDIFINSSNELKIVPQTQANEMVLEGIIMKISDIFEGVVK
jgi:hypothetical protein